MAHARMLARGGQETTCDERVRDRLLERILGLPEDLSDPSWVLWALMATHPVRSGFYFSLSFRLKFFFSF